MLARILPGFLVSCFLTGAGVLILWAADIQLTPKEMLFALILVSTWWGVSQLREEVATIRARVEKGSPLTDEEQADAVDTGKMPAPTKISPQ